MTKINHERPIFKLLASLQKARAPELSRLAKTYVSAPPPQKVTYGRTLPRPEQEIVQQIIVGMLEPLGRNKDVRTINSLMDHIEKDADRKALRMWFSEFSCALWSEKQKKFIYSRDHRVKRYEAAQHPYWKFIMKAPSISRVFNFTQELEKLVVKATERRMRRVPGDEIDADLLTVVRDLLRAR